MTRIAMMMLPEAGHVFPTLPLARALRARGHQVVYLGPAGCEGLVRDSGFRWRAVFPANPSPADLRRHTLDGAIVDALAGEQADQVLADSLDIAPILAAHQLGKLAVALSIVLPPFQRRGIPPLRSAAVGGDSLATVLSAGWRWKKRAFVGWPKPWARRGERYVLDRRDVLELARRCGYPESWLDWRTEFTAAVSRRVPTWVLCSATLDFPGAPTDRCSYTGHFDDALRRHRDAESVRVASAPVYFSLGSQAARYPLGPRCLAAFLAAMAMRPSLRAVVNAGGIDVPASSVPDNATVIEWAPQAELLRAARVVVTHAGLGTVKECVHDRVPMVTLPQFGDQYGNAARVAFHGLGLAIDPMQVDASTLGCAIDTCLEDRGMRARLSRQAARLAGDPHWWAAELERLARDAPREPGNDR